MKNILFLFTRKFPFGIGEDFIENEMKIAVDYFDEIVIIPTIVVKEEKATKNIPSKVVVKPIYLENGFNKCRFYIENFIRSVFCKDTYVEWKNNGFKNIIKILIYSIYGHNIYKHAEKQLTSYGKEQIFLYSYWAMESSYAVGLLKKRFKNIRYAFTRLHGYDLYEERQINHYFPFRKMTFERLNYLFPCSKMGREYLLNKYPNISVKCIASYLGTENNYDVSKYRYEREVFHFVTCSNVIKLKRLDRIFNAISLCPGFKKKIIWTCIGDGDMLQELKEKSKMQNLIDVEFKGRMSNSEVHYFYRHENIDLFINVSESEGLPVSIMEAMSYGIPVLATNVGGVCEMVYHLQNGFLLDKNFLDKDFLEALNSFLYMDVNRYMGYREKSRMIWEQKFSSDFTYKKFYELLLEDKME